MPKNKTRKHLSADRLLSISRSKKKTTRKILSANRLLSRSKTYLNPKTRGTINKNGKISRVNLNNIRTLFSVPEEQGTRKSRRLLDTKRQKI